MTEIKLLCHGSKCRELQIIFQMQSIFQMQLNVPLSITGKICKCEGFCHQSEKWDSFTPSRGLLDITESCT